MSDRNQSQPKFAYIGKVLSSVPDQCDVHSPGGNISAESFRFFPDIFFSKDCMKEK